MLKNKYYWIKIDGTTCTYIPMLYNIDGLWCHDTLQKRLFITTAQLKRLYGGDCILREVDLIGDKGDATDSRYTMHHMTDGTDVMFGNKYFVYYNGMCVLVPTDNSDCSELIYK